MRPRTAALLVVATWLAIVPGAEAATPSQVLEDWREPDGTIDGDYTLAELRRADAMINPQEREYTFWDEAYAEAVRRIRHRATKPTRRQPTDAPRNFNGDRKIDTVAPAAKRRAAHPRNPVRTPDPEPAADDRRTEIEPVASRGDDDDRSARTFGLFALIPGLVVGGGMWRLWRIRRRDDFEPRLPPPMK